MPFTFRSLIAVTSFSKCGTFILMSRYPSGIHLWLILWKSYNAVRDYAFRDIASLGLGLSDFAILEVLLHKGATPVNDIGAKVLLTSGSMTTAIDRLPVRKIVERRADPGNPRATAAR